MKSEYFIFHKNHKPLDFRKRLNVRQVAAQCKLERNVRTHRMAYDAILKKYGRIIEKQRGANLSIEEAGNFANEIAKSLGFRIDSSKYDSVSSMTRSIANQAKQFVEIVKEQLTIQQKALEALGVSGTEGLLKVLGAKNWDEARAMAIESNNLALTQKIQEVDENQATIARIKKEPAPDLARKMDMMRSEYGDPVIDAVERELKDTDYYIVDVIAYTLIIERKGEDELRNLQGANQYTFETEDDDFERETDLFFANSDEQLITKLKSSQKAQNQTTKLLSYVERDKRKTIFDIDQNRFRMNLNPLMQKRASFDTDRFNDRRKFFNEGGEFDLTDQHIEVLFLSHDELLNNAAAIHKMSENKTFISDLINKLQSSMSQDLNTIKQNCTTIKDTIAKASLPEDDKKYIDEMLSKHSDIEKVTGTLMDAINELHKQLQGQSTEKRENIYADIEQGFNALQEKIVTLYILLNNNAEKSITIQSDCNVKKLLDKNEEIIASLQYNCARFIETIILSQNTVSLIADLKADSILKFIKTLDLLMNTLLNTAATRLESDCYSLEKRNSKGETYNDKVYVGEICAKFAEVSAALLVDIYNGNDISGSFEKFSNVVREFATISGILIKTDYGYNLSTLMSDLRNNIGSLGKFCKYLSSYYKVKKDMSMPSSILDRITCQFLTSNQLASFINSDFSNYFSNRYRILLVSTRELLKNFNYRSNEEKDENRIKFLVNADAGKLNGVRVGVALDLSNAIKRPKHNIKLKLTKEGKITTQEAEYLFHTKIHPVSKVETPVVQEMAERLKELMNNEKISSFESNVKKFIDEQIALGEDARRLYIPAELSTLPFSIRYDGEL
ncbi:MAG: hypothetical protein E7015_04280, partial [Alphaproteobacteria bacterium]|nr:hypothetical protein [Alphaproteobacteria bacterium]